MRSPRAVGAAGVDALDRACAQGLARRASRRARTATSRRSTTNASIGSRPRIAGLPVVLNGGIADIDQAAAHLGHVDGVMMGRAAYQEPWRLLAVDPLLFGEPCACATPKAAAEALIPYIERELARGARLHAITRHVLGLFRAACPARAPFAAIWRPRR